MPLTWSVRCSGVRVAVCTRRPGYFRIFPPKDKPQNVSWKQNGGVQKAWEVVVTLVSERASLPE
eukprot:9772103-Alexandrium_andersonii.AAC.1